MTKENRGGFRENARRPLKYGEPTQRISIRVPVSQVDKVKKLVNGFLEQFIKK